jgi:hypothetical protein
MQSDDRRDEVDELVASWRRERPDLPAEPLEVLSRVNRVAQRLDEVAARPSPPTISSCGSSTCWRAASQRRSLSAVARPPVETEPRHLGHYDEPRRPACGPGLVGRHTDPSDGRGVIVRSPRGQGPVDAALADLLAWEERQLAALGADDRSALAALLRRLLLAVVEA